MPVSHATQPVSHYDVIIVGNGPSSIILSYILSGRRPYYKYRHVKSCPGGLVSQHLHHRLCQHGDNPLTSADLQYLCQDVSGRSLNPVSNLLDSLSHPGADEGQFHESLLEWLLLPHHRHVQHLVLGPSAPGGVWQRQSGEMRTVSVGRWMQLPGLALSQWRSDIADNERVHACDMAQYYCHYVRHMNLEQYFCNNSLVQQVSRLQEPSSSQPSTITSSSSTAATLDRGGVRRWLVRGVHHALPHEPVSFSYTANCVVLACGGSDASVRVQCAGEHLPLVRHGSARVGRLLRCDGVLDGAVMIVGAGLSAADAVIAALRRGVDVVHVFRRAAADKRLVYAGLPRTPLYAEYQRVHDMMRAPPGSWPRYWPLPQSRVTGVRADGRVTVEHCGTSVSHTVHVTHVAVLVGTRPSLQFISGADRARLAVDPDSSLDSRSNPVHVDVFSHECVRAPALYALGPLVGDSLVRMLLGGAVCVAADLLRRTAPSPSQGLSVPCRLSRELNEDDGGLLGEEHTELGDEGGSLSSSLTTLSDNSSADLDVSACSPALPHSVT